MYNLLFLITWRNKVNSFHNEQCFILKGRTGTLLKVLQELKLRFFLLFPHWDLGKRVKTNFFFFRLHHFTIKRHHKTNLVIQVQTTFVCVLRKAKRLAKSLMSANSVWKWWKYPIWIHLNDLIDLGLEGCFLSSLPLSDVTGETLPSVWAMLYCTLRYVELIWHEFIVSERQKKVS